MKRGFIFLWVPRKVAGIFMFNNNPIHRETQSKQQTKAKFASNPAAVACAIHQQQRKRKQKTVNLQAYLWTGLNVFMHISGVDVDVFEALIFRLLLNT